MADGRYYERLKADGSLERCPMNDYDGNITGKIVFNVPAYFDENPGEALRLGWDKHITKDVLEIDYDRQTQYLQRAVRRIDEHTVEDVYTVCDKSEEMLARDELSGYSYSYSTGAVTGITLIGDDETETITIGGE